MLAGLDNVLTILPKSMRNHMEIDAMPTLKDHMERDGRVVMMAPEDVMNADAEGGAVRLREIIQLTTGDGGILSIRGPEREACSKDK